MAARPGPPTRPAIRLRPAPPLDPPYDDEMAPVTWARGPAGQLTLNLSPRPAGTRPTDRHPEAPPRPARTITTSLPAEALATASPEARRAARRFLDTCLEVVNGYRPAAQLRVLTSPETARTIIGQLSAATTRFRGPGRRPGIAATPVRLRLLRVCEPRPGVAEVAAVLGHTGPTFALAFRLERHQGSWLGTAADLI